VKLTFLGTAAAEGYPNPFCRCANCEGARALGGPSLRKRASALINDDLLLDLGPDLIAAAQTYGRSLAGVRYCLQTHAHSDHLDLAHFQIRTAEYGVRDAPRLHFYASAGTLRRAAHWFEAAYSPFGLLDPRVDEQFNLKVHQVEAFQTFGLGPYRVTAFSANHDPSTEPLLYAIQDEGRTIFYGVDTASLPEETWRAFHAKALRFDVVVLDHTYGPDGGGNDHLNASEFAAHVRRMRAEGLLADGARVFAHHIAHETNPPHPQLVTLAAAHGYEVAYDGLTV
jgi:phosphoribosyl 1,2-cyclic phosphate phosphodiesterase